VLIFSLHFAPHQTHTTNNPNRYQRYLESVLEVADEYQEIGELLMRHSTLQATNRDLRKHMAWCDESADAARSQLAAFVKQRTDELLLLNNQLSQLKQQLEAYEQEAGVQEAAKDSTLKVASQRTLVYGQVVLATDNLFTQCRQRSHIAHAAYISPVQQLDVIGNYLSDLTAACKQRTSSTSSEVQQEPANADHYSLDRLSQAQL